jgi:uncharacterized membrane protein YfcA
VSILLAAVAVALGGIMKGAIGAGVPILAAPALAMLYDVPTAVAILVVPNLASNLWQAWAYRREALGPAFLVQFAGGGMLGVAFGTWLLTVLRAETLSLLVAFAVIGYIALRMARPGWTLARSRAARLSGPAGTLGGLLQGATGVSAPVSITFLSAMRLPRETFIATISIFFVAMTAMQIPALWGVGLMTGEHLVMGLAALGVVMLSMPVGAWLGKRASPVLFDRLMLAVLAVIAAKILLETLLGIG